MDDICVRLKSLGYRITGPRKLILDALSGCPQTAAEIKNKIMLKHMDVDAATIYRTLEVLVDLGVVRKVNLANNSASFELLSGDDHHHHLVCNKCGKIEDICMDESTLLCSVTKHTKFKVQDHTLEFFGLCTNCQ